MYAIETRVFTANANRYLLQLCKHWAHKREVVFTPSEARVPFTEGAECLLGADADGLDVRINAADASEASRLGQVVIDHLLRFAFREGLQPPVWRLVPDAGAA